MSGFFECRHCRNIQSADNPVCEQCGLNSKTSPRWIQIAAITLVVAIILLAAWQGFDRLIKFP